MLASGYHASDRNGKNMQRAYHYLRYGYYMRRRFRAPACRRRSGWQRLAVQWHKQLRQTSADQYQRFAGHHRGSMGKANRYDDLAIPKYCPPERRHRIRRRLPELAAGVSGVRQRYRFRYHGRWKLPRDAVPDHGVEFQ